MARTPFHSPSPIRYNRNAIPYYQPPSGCPGDARLRADFAADCTYAAMDSAAMYPNVAAVASPPTYPPLGPPWIPPAVLPAANRPGIARPPGARTAASGPIFAPPMVKVMPGMTRAAWNGGRETGHAPRTVLCAAMARASRPGLQASRCARPEVVPERTRGAAL